MLNRTNRTLSANLNRLNLGTRSLAVAAGLNIGEPTLRTRHAHRDVMRDGIIEYRPSPIPISRDAMPSIPSSSSVSPGLVASPVVWPWVDFAVEASFDTDRRCRVEDPRGPFLRRGQALQGQGLAKSGRKPLTGKRPRGIHGLGTLPANADPSTAAATLAAAAG